MKNLTRVATAIAVLMFTLPLLAGEEATFDRTLKVTGPVDLEVVTGSGNITIRAGAAGSLTVHGTVKAGCCSLFGAQDPAAAVKSIAANPPIEQSGSVVRIGHLGETQRHNNISISYELVVPAETKLLSKTGSGNQDVSGVAGPAEVTTGSGNLRLADIAGEVRAHTGSGGITMANLRSSVRAHTGSGHIHGEHVGFASSADTRPPSNSFSESSTAGGSNLDLQTGSGAIRVDDIRGQVRARTGSGTIELQGQPTGDWSMTTGSGGITVRLPAQAAFDLNAHTSSGSIHTDRDITVQGGTTGKHDLRGKVNGGGFHLDLQTGSGSIRIE
jgi:DUF4097 and DUF4098 domain-containing protein YvlB